MKKIIIVVLILLIVVVGISGYYYIRPNKPKVSLPTTATWEKKGLFSPSDLVAAKVGSDTIYNKDLNYLLYTRYYSNIASPPANLAGLKSKILEEAIDDSVVVQSKNLPFSGIESKYQTAENLKKEFEEKSEERISGAVISVWYHNVDLPKGYTPEQTRTIALSKITAVYNEVKSGKITVAQAGEKLKSDSSLANIDPSYKGNAYFEFKNIPVAHFSVMSAELKKAVLALNAGEITDIVEKKSGKPGPVGEEFFAFAVLSKRDNSGKGSLEEWLVNLRSKYEINK